MSANRIVSALLGETDDITPEEVVKSVPEIFIRYEFTPSMGMGKFSVKRWEHDGYRYVGEVWHDEVNDLWMASKVAPCGRQYTAWCPSSGNAPERHTREEAARDLWRLYSQKLEDGTIRVRS